MVNSTRYHDPYMLRSQTYYPCETTADAVFLFMSDQRESALRLEPSVPEAWVREIVLAGYSPNEFATWVLKRGDLEELLSEYGATSPTRGHRRRINPDVATTSLGTADAPRASRDRWRLRWTRTAFSDFLDLVSSIEDMAPSLRLLGAYVRLGAVPSSDGLRRLCGFDDEPTWQQALRVAKQRLTLEARRVNAPPLFPRAKSGPQGQRFHPIEPRLYGWLIEWGERRAGDLPPEEAFPHPEAWGLGESTSDQEIES